MTGSPLNDIAERLLAAVASKDLDAVLMFFAEDALFVDPHYPVPRMEGKQAIADGFRWAFAGLERMGFTIDRFFLSDDGTSAAAEVTTDHIVRGEMRLQFHQVFIVETRDGLITRLQSYVPYGPPGIGGLFLRLTRLKRRLFPGRSAG